MAEPMQTWVEIWPVAADPAGIWLLSGDAAWCGDLPVMADSEPHFEVEGLLSTHGVRDDAVLLHSTSWRVDGPRIVLTYVAVIQAGGLEALVRDRWPTAGPIGSDFPARAGRPHAHGPNEVPTPRRVDVLMHAVRHLRFLLDSSASNRSAFDANWRRHLDALTPALAGMYEPAAP